MMFNFNFNFNFFKSLFSFFNYKIFSFTNIFVISTIRLINILIKRKSRLFNSFLLKKTGYTFSNFADAFSVSSLFLVFFKLSVRLLGYNTFWQINLLILLLGTFFSLHYMLIKNIRNLFRKFWKKALGLRYYFYYKSSQAIDFGLHYMSHEELLNWFKVPNFNSFNYFFHQIFYGLLFLRLFIYSELYLFIIFNFFFTYLLLINKYLIFSSLLSIILAVSRFTFLLADHNYTLLKFRLSSFIKSEGNEVLTPTYDNAVLMGIIVTRLLQYEDNDEDLEYFQTLKEPFQSGTYYHKGYLADKILLLDKKRTEIAKIIHTLRFGEDIPLHRIQMIEHIYPQPFHFRFLKEDSILKIQNLTQEFFKKKKQNEYFFPVILSIISFFLLSFFSPVNQDFNQSMPKGIVENLRRFFNLPISGKSALSLRQELALKKTDANFLDSRIIDHPAVVSVDEKERIYIHNLSKIDPFRCFMYLKKIAYFQNLSVVTLGETFQGNSNASAILSTLPLADSAVEQAINNNAMVYHEKKLQKRFLEIMSKNDQKDFETSLELFREMSLNVQHNIYSYVVIAILDPRNSINDVKQLIEIKEGFEKYTVSYDNNIFLFSDLVKKYLPKVQDYYSKEDNLQLSQHLYLVKDFLNEMSKIKNPTIFDEIETFSKIYNKDPQEVLKEYSNIHTSSEFKEIKSYFISANDLSIKETKNLVGSFSKALDEAFPKSNNAHVKKDYLNRGSDITEE